MSTHLYQARSWVFGGWGQIRMSSTDNSLPGLELKSHEMKSVWSVHDAVNRSGLKPKLPSKHSTVTFFDD
ncbi:hypothetical protein COCHEDRAFT_1023913, partial [Bipolaris maydis C5]